MITLALDSSAVTAAVAITEGNTLLAQAAVDGVTTHSETLLPLIEQLLSSTHLTLDDIDLFACPVGPGSFTGIRIGVSLLRGLCFGRGKPCVGVSTLEALAENLCGIGAEPAILCPVMDARRGQFYNALFNADGTRLTEDRLITAPELREELKKRQVPFYAVGDGYALAQQLLELPDLMQVTPSLLRRQSGYSVAICANRIYAENPDRDFSDLACKPVYLRASQAERERMERMNTKS